MRNEDRREWAQAVASAFRVGGMKAIQEMGVTIPELPGARWEEEAVVAALTDGWQVVKTAGVADYQGWGALLLCSGERWATLNWFYGSCGGCDSYEGDSTESVIASLAKDIDVHASEDDARMKFDGKKGW